MLRRLLPLLLLLEAGVILAAMPAATPDWPHARGPQFDGRFPRATPLHPWPTAGPAKQWEQPLGQGFSGLVVAGGRIFTQHQTSSGQELLCLDLASGAIVWRSRYAYPWEMDGRYPGPYGTPTVAGDRVYFSDCYGMIACAAVADGVIRWRFDAVKALTPGGVDFGYAATPLVLAGRVYAPTPAGGGNASVFCLDAITGALLWQSGTSHPSYASCQPLSLGGKDYLLLPLRNGIALFDRQSGAEIWKDEWTRGYDEHSIWPIFADPYLFCTSPFRRGTRVYRLAATAGGVQAESVWEQRIHSNDVLASVLHDGHLYGFDVQSQQSELLGRTRGTLKCVELSTGSIKWTQTGIKHCSATLVGARVLLLEDEGDLVLMDPSATGYRELARSTLPQTGKFWAAPVLIGDRLLVRGRDSLASYALAFPSAVVGRAPPRAPAAGAMAGTMGLGPAVRAWFKHHRTAAFIAPSLPTLLQWYAWSLLLLGAALGLERWLPTKRRGGGWAWLAALLGLAATGGLTTLLGRFTFTAPLSLFAGFCLAVPAANDPWRNPDPAVRRWRSYLTLAGFIALCYGYYVACSWLFLVSGWGFLTGFPIVVLLVWAGQRLGPRSGKLPGAVAPLWRLIAFTAYYWSSVLAILWSAK